MFDDNVGVVDLASEQVVSRIRVGKTPNGISFSTEQAHDETADKTPDEHTDMDMGAH